MTLPGSPATESGLTLASALAEIVHAHADRTCLHSGTVSLTYADLAQRAARITARLAADGFGRGSVVALLLPQGAPFIAGIVGTLQSGAAFVPLDPTYPEDRNRFMATDAGSVCVLACDETVELAAALGDTLPLINIDHLKPASGSVDIEPPEPDDLAYILYTSGSTGRPKGVMQPHRSVLHNALRHKHVFGLTLDDRQTLLYPCSVYGGIRDIFNALLVGAGLYHYPVREAGYAGVVDWLAEHEVTIYCSVASVFRQFARTLTGKGMYPHLRFVKLGGEAPYATDLALFREHFCPDTTLLCGLGSTETGMSCRYLLRADTTLESNAIPLGHPAQGIDVMVVDESRRPVPAGEIGEIAIRSRYITTGYHGRDDLNTAVFATCEEDPRARIFYTGDLGQLDDEGRLWHRGRRDQQIKIRGNRIELVEVEAAIAAHPAVRDAVALGETNEAGDTQLAAYLVLEPEALPPTVAELRDSMKSRVPRFMIPSTFHRIERVPLTPNGKIDRRALAQVESTPLAVGRTFRSPSTPTQQRVAEIFAELLRLPSVGVTDTFFDLGGDSLQAVDLLLRIERAFGRAPSVAALVTMATVEELSGWLDGPGDASHRGVLKMNKVDNVTKPPLVFFPGKGGSGMSFLAVTQRLDQDRAIYCLQYPGLNSNATPIDRMEPLVDELMRRLEQTLPEGPLALIGYSFGGLVAYETACRLAERGRTIDRLILIDTIVPGVRRRRSRVRRMLAHAQKLYERPEHGRWRYLLDRLGTRNAGSDAPQKSEPRDEIRRRLDGIARACERASARFMPRGYDGDLYLLQCQRRERQVKYAELPESYGWEKTCAGAITRLPIDSDHNDVMRAQNVEALAATLRPILA